MKLYVDKDGCIACRSCVNTCPEVFKIGEDGYAETYVDEVPSTVLEAALEAKEICPTEVISEK